MTKAYSYIRFSSPEQAKGRSQARQLEACEDYCRRQGLELQRDEDSTFLDRGRSAFKAEHVGEKGQLKRFLDCIEDGTVPAGSVLIVESLDRLSRENVRIAQGQLMAITARGVDVVTLSDGRRYSKDDGEDAVINMIVAILVMSRAHEESKTKGARVGDAWRKKHEKARELGTPTSKAIPLWLTLEPEGFKVVEDRAAVVRRVFQMAVDGYGREATAKALNAGGVQSFKGVTWGTSSIEKILNNRSVLGEYQTYSVQGTDSGTRQAVGEPIQNFYPAIIDETTFYAAKEAVSARRLSGATKQSKNFNVWSKIAVCALCGKALHMVNKGKTPKGGTYLHCSEARKGACKAKAVRLDKSEIVFKEILTKVDSLALIKDDSAKIARELAALEGKLSEEIKVAQRHTDALKTFSTSTAIYGLLAQSEAAIATLKQQKEQLQESLALERIASKDEFFSKLDLVSYEGRSAANGLLQRLKVVVKISRGKYLVEKDGAKLLSITDNDGLLSTVPLSLDQIEKAKTLDFDGSLDSALTLLAYEYAIHEHTGNKLSQEEFDARGAEMLARVDALK